MVFWSSRDTERFFDEVSREEAPQLVEDTEGLGEWEVWTSSDAEGREGVEWINVLARRPDLEQ